MQLNHPIQVKPRSFIKMSLMVVLFIFQLSLAIALLSGCAGNKEGDQPATSEVLEGETKAVLTFAPDVPPPIQRYYPTKVIVELEAIEVVKQLTDGVDYTFWTFGGEVPGKFIRVREGDEVEFHLKNADDSKMPHNIDLHAVTGPGGGATSSFTTPGKMSIFSFKVLNPGLYVYHCATAPVGMHIANGMYGLILVEPKEGLKKVDREYYIMQSEFYTRDRFGKEGLQPFDMQKALDENPDYVVFNGSVGAMVGDKAITAKVGETVRLYVGNGGPNLVSSFHVIGEIFDLVYQEGGSEAQKNVQTTLIPAGGSAIVEFKVDVPGTYIIVDHSIFRAFNKGALAMLNVEGPEDKKIYSGRQEDLERIYMPEGSAIQSVPHEETAKVDFSKMSDADLMAKGKRLFLANCSACHMAEGQGVANAFPPLAKSDYLMADKNRSILTVLKGLTGEITVNGKKYNNVMPSVHLADEEVAAIMTFVRGSWGNNGDKVTPAEVAKLRK